MDIGMDDMQNPFGEMNGDMNFDPRPLPCEDLDEFGTKSLALEKNFSYPF